MRGFRTVAQRLIGEADRRLAMAELAAPWHVAFLDDYLKALMTHDLVLVGAPSGIGKTEFALSVASAAAEHGRRVAFFALEAEPDEIERRLKYRILARMLWEAGDPVSTRMNFAEWMLGRFEESCRRFNRAADVEILQRFGKLSTFYKEDGTGSLTFDHVALEKAIIEIHTHTDVIVVDHLHYLDSEDANEQRGLLDAMKSIRRVSVQLGKPVILVVHLTKKDDRSPRITSSLGDVHGSSNITKIATAVVLLDPAPSVQTSRWYHAPTFMSIAKDRRNGSCRYVAMVNYDTRGRVYEPWYTLGKLTPSKGGKLRWEPLARDAVPEWARQHQPLSDQMELT